MSLRGHRPGPQARSVRGWDGPQVHALLRPSQRRHDPGVRQIVPDGIDPVRRRRAATETRPASSCRAEGARGDKGRIVRHARRQRGHRGRSAARVLSAAGQAADLQPARGPTAAAQDDGTAVRVERRRRRRVRAGRRPRLRPTPMSNDRPPAGYYNYPVVRRPVWTWEVPAYFWLGGMAAGAYVTAALAQNFGSADDRRVAAGGYYVAATALVPCAPLLIADLGRPDRFYHMLRIFKPLSPMNLGAWTLTALTPIAFARAASHAASTGLLRGPLGTLARLVPTRLAQLAGVGFGFTLAGYS